MAEGDAYGVRSAVQAAKDLKNYINQPGASLGSKAAPSVFVQAAQRDMGGGLTADGIFGPKTRTRMNALLSAGASPAPAPTPNIAAAALVAPPDPAAIVAPPTPTPVPVVATPAVVAQPEPEPALATVMTPAIAETVAAIPA